MNEHTEFDLLDEYVLGTLDAAQTARVSEHIRTCALCRAECAEIRSVFDVLPQALPQEPPSEALRDRIFAAIDPPVKTSRAVLYVRALAAALLLALAGDAFLALRLGQRTTVAIAPPATEPSATIGPAPVGFGSTAPPALGIRPAVRPRATPRPDAQARRTIAALTRELDVARSQAQIDRRRLRRLQAALLAARATPRVVAARPTPLPRSTGAPAPGAERLVAALRTGRVYAIDGAIADEPWHLTIVQPRNGGHALVYSGTPGAPSGDTYRTWVVRSGRTVSIGELPPGKPATLEMPMALAPGDVVAFTREPIGSGNVPTTPFLMKLKITQ